MTSSLGAARTTVLAVMASVSVVAGGAVVLSAPATAQSTLSPAGQETIIDTMEVVDEPTPSEPTPSAPSPSAPSPSPSPSPQA